MAKASQTANHEPDLGSVVKDTVRDAERLLVQHLELFRSEMQEELAKAKGAAVSLGAGAGLVAAGGFLSAFMLVHFLQRTTGLPLWACYGLVGGGLGAAGAKYLAAGVKEAADVQLMPTRTVEALKENLTWLKDQATPELS